MNTRLLALLCCLLALCAPAFAGQGRIVVGTLHAHALEGNRVGDTADRRVTIYLPASYDRDPARRYPVVYLLHGATSDPREWLDGTYQGMDLRVALDAVADDAAYIVVMPMADNALGGAFYVDSAAFGRWEQAIAEELVAFVDARFRTLPSRESRGLAGQSMGGFGALSLAGRHPETFGHVYATSPCCLGLVGDLAPEGARWQPPPRGLLRAMAMAFAPADADADVDAATPPLPFVAGPDGQMREVPAVAQAWRAHMPLEALRRDPAPYRRLCSIALDAGLQDEIPNVTAGAAAFSQALQQAGIAHAYEAFAGTHTDHLRQRFETALLPFFARVLATPARPGACAGG